MVLIEIIDAEPFIDADSLFEGILACIGEQKRITDDQEKIYNTMLDLKKQGRIPFSYFFFDLDHPSPYCKDIDLAIRDLRLGGLLGWDSGRREYIITSGLIKHFEKTQEEYGITQEIMPRLRKLAGDFYQQLNLRVSE